MLTQDLLIFSYNTETGFICRNEDQKFGHRCFDYKVRFRCPCFSDQWIHCCQWPRRGNESYSGFNFLWFMFHLCLLLLMEYTPLYCHSVPGILSYLSLMPFQLIGLWEKCVFWLVFFFLELWKKSTAIKSDQKANFFICRYLHMSSVPSLWMYQSTKCWDAD